MTDNMELTRNSVASVGWRCMVGMRVYSPSYQVYYRILSVNRRELCLALDATGIGAPVVQYRDIDDRAKYPTCVEQATPLLDWVDDLVPDLTDPATLGCLLNLVKEAEMLPSDSSLWLDSAALMKILSGGV